MNSELKPKIRFKGFTDDWEQRKLKDIYKFQYGEYNNNPDNGGIYPIYGANGIIGGYTRYNAEDSVIIGHMGEYAGSVLWGEGKTFVTYNGTISEPKDQSINSKFGYYMLFQKEINRICAGSGLPFLSYEQLNKIEVSYPDSVQEQTSISNLLTDLDNLITLHQRKCDKLVELKKSLLEKMFPQNKSVIPEIRFKGFTDEWEQRKYKDIGIPLSGGNLSYDSLDDDGDKKCVLYGDLYTKYDCIIQNIKNRTFEVGNSIVKNDILFPQSTTVDAYSLISPACLNEEKAETSGVFVIRPYKDINGNFICYYTKGNIEQRKKLSKKAQGLTIVHLYYHSIKDENIMVPNKDEQDKIASVLLNIDNLITLHQRKHDKLNKIKQSLLNDMFV